MSIRDAVDETNTAINDLRNVRKQIDTVGARAKKFGGMESVIELGDSINEKLSAIEEELIQHRSKSNQDPLNFPVKLDNKIAALSGAVARSNGKPTDATYQVLVLDYLLGV